MTRFAQKRGFQPVVGLALLLGAYAPPVPTSFGAGPRFHPPPASKCGHAVTGVRSRVHLELFAQRRVVLIPAGVGVARHCAARTTAPTGVIEFAARARPTLGDFFAIWREPLGRTRLAGFGGTVRGYVEGRRWRGDVRKIPLTAGGQITVEIGGFIQPHAFFLFPTTGA